MSLRWDKLPRDGRLRFCPAGEISGRLKTRPGSFRHAEAALLAQTGAQGSSGKRHRTRHGHDINRTTLVITAPDEPLFFKIFNVLVNRRQGGKTQGFPDLLETG